MTDRPQIADLVPPMADHLHKGQAGRIAVLGGCKEYTGAPYYAAMASLRLVRSAAAPAAPRRSTSDGCVDVWVRGRRQGADLAFVFCQPDAAIPVKAYSPELIVVP